MKVVRNVIDRLTARKSELEEEMAYWQARREDARAEGDLSENQDYEEARKKLDELYSELTRITSVIMKSEVVDLTNSYNIIDVGCVFHAKITYPGRNIEEEKVYDESGQMYIYYDSTDDTTVFEHDIVFCGPIDSYSREFMWSSQSDFGRNIIGKPLGEYKIMTKNGKYILVELTEGSVSSVSN